MLLSLDTGQSIRDAISLIFAQLVFICLEALDPLRKHLFGRHLGVAALAITLLMHLVWERLAWARQALRKAATQIKALFLGVDLDLLISRLTVV